MDGIVRDVYESLNGDVLPEMAVPWVEDAFAEGDRCALLYQQVYEANIRLCQRLGDREEDDDVELIINNLLIIQQILCEKMFHYGYRVGRGLEKL